MDVLSLPAWIDAWWAGPPAREPRAPARAKAMAAPEPQQADAEVFALVRRGDAAAFAEFYDRHSTLLFGVALRILGDAHEAEDVLQEAAVQIWERAPLHDPSLGKPVSWAVALTRNKAIDRLRSARRRSALDAAAGTEAGFGEDTEPAAPQAAMTSETTGFVRTALTSLPAEQRAAIELAFFGGLTQAEIADRLRVPLGTVKARIRRGMIALKDLLEGNL